SFLRLAETLTAFLQRLRASAELLEITERQKIVRLLVKEVLVDNDTITIRHSIPSHPKKPPSGSEPHSNGTFRTDSRNCLLRSGRDNAPLRGTACSLDDFSVLLHRRCQPSFDVQQRPLACDVLPDRFQQEIMRKIVKGTVARLPITKIYRRR